MRIAIDCEFSFDADSEFVCICACTTQEDGQQFTFWRTEMDALRDYIVSHKGDTFVAHNVETAEGYLFQSLCLLPTKFRWHDTLLMSRIVHNSCAVDKPLHSLDRCLAREHIVEIDHDTKKENQSICIWKQDCSWMDHITQMDAHKAHLLKYCLSDTEHLLELDDKLNAKLVASLTPGKWNHIDFDKPLEPSRRADYYGFLAAMASETSWRGIPLDLERVARIKNNAPHAIAKMQLEFLKLYPYTFRKEGDKLKMNTAKCREYAAKVYGDKPPRTKAGAVSLASEYTEPHKDCDDFLGHYYNLMKACRALSSFAKPNREKNWLGFYLPKRGIVRPRLNLLGTATGRCGSKPSTGFVYTMGKAFRGLVNPPEGKVLVELDFHSQEIGIQCYLSHDKRMAKLYEGPDYYTSIAHSIDPSITQKKDPRRDQYKRVCLMSNYGAGVDHLAEVSKLSKTKAAHVLQHLKTMFSTYWQYVEACKQSCTRSRYLWFSDGFRINFNGGKATSLCNWPFQGCGAYILRQMMVELYKAKIELVAPVHDAIVFMADEATWKATADKAAEIMKSVSLRAVGTVIDVGAPEVTFHDVVNCHSELSSREAYASTKPNKYKLQYDKFMEDVDCSMTPDVENLYLDEEYKNEQN